MNRKLMVETVSLMVLVSVLAFTFCAKNVKANDSWVWVRNTVSGAWGEAVVGTGDAIYIAKENSFYRYDPSDNSWAELAGPPNPDSGDAFKTGTALTWDFNDYIYALYGAATGDSRRWFYRYSTSSNSWEALANTTADQGEGDAIAWVVTDNCVYATIGGEQRPTYFMRYDPSNNSWSDAPADPLAGMGDGASLVWTGGDFLYALRGEFSESSPLHDFWRYSLSGDVWTVMADIPADPHNGGVGGVGDGGSLVHVGSWLSNQTDYIFALSGNQVLESPDNRTYRYTISLNRWERLADLPFRVGYYVGCRLGYADGHIYAWQGTPSTWEGGGDDLAYYIFPPELEYVLGISSTTGGTTVPAPGNYTYSAGVKAKVTATPWKSYRFDNWELDGEDAGSQNPIEIMMNTNHTVHAVFQKSVHQGDLVLSGNNVTTIEDRRFEINGSIIVEENATLILRNALVNFTQKGHHQLYMTFQNPANGNPRLVVENATITSCGYSLNILVCGNSSATIDRLSTSSDIRFLMFDSSSASMLNSTIGGMYPQAFSILTASGSSFHDFCSYDDSSVTVSNCTFSYMAATDNSEMTAANCTINTCVSPSSRSANYSIAELKPGFVSYWNFKLNCSVTVAPTGSAPNLTLEDTEVEGWCFDSLGNSNATIFNSELYALWSHESAAISVYNSTIANLWGYESSHWHLCNTMTQKLHSLQDSKIWLTNSSSNTYIIGQQSEVYVSWYLDVHVTDSEGTDIPSANVTATYPNTTVAESRLTNAQGWARLILMEKMMNYTGEYSVGNYTVTAEYEVHTGQESVNMTENREITVSLPFIIPEFPSFIILPLFMIATLLIVIVYRCCRVKPHCSK